MTQQPKCYAASMSRLLRLWFGLSMPVDRRTYLVHGAALMAFKYASDVLLVWLASGRWWSPIQYVLPVFSLRQRALGPAPEWVWIAEAIWALPFLWIGVSMTLRRLLDARISPWLVLLFFVPLVSWVLLAALSLLPSSREVPLNPAHARISSRLRAALQGIAAGVGIGAVSVGLYVLIFKSYSASVFLGTPFTMGAAAGYLYNRRGEQPGTAALGALTVFIAGLAMLFFALEGVICLLMALPLAMVIAMLGASAGRLIARERRDSSPAAAALLLLLLPSSGALDARLQSPPLREVLSSVDIAASPEQVWPHVLGFADIEEPPQWFFRLGIAYPVRARLSGTGAGAVRRCEFSTGAFVEPITAWDEPRRLAFDVASQPPPMAEWSPYRHVHAQHLLDTLQSRRGEFRLVPLPGGRTRLEGRTFYTLAMDPQPYWSFFSDLLIHRIHQRVLQHIRAEVDAATAARAPAAK